MEVKHRFDPRFGVSDAAFTIAHLINFTTNETVTWSPFYNCRERGICLVVGLRAWIFGEHRNSDALYLDRLNGIFWLNPPTLTAFDENAYYNRELFRHDAHWEVARTIMAEIEEHKEALCVVS